MSEKQIKKGDAPEEGDGESTYSAQRLHQMDDRFTAALRRAHLDRETGPCTTPGTQRPRFITASRPGLPQVHALATVGEAA